MSQGQSRSGQVSETPASWSTALTVSDAALRPLECVGWALREVSLEGTGMRNSPNRYGASAMTKATSWVLYLEIGISDDAPHPEAGGTGSNITHREVIPV